MNGVDKYVNNQRTFIPGQSWLYYKIYTGTKTAEKVLVEELIPESEKYIGDNLIDNWFFIRYSDRGFHIRLRFRLINPSGIGQIMYELSKRLGPFVDQDIIWDVEIGTYKRELERYGEELMEFSECLFHYDSKMVGEILKCIYLDYSDGLRWLVGLKSIDTLMDTIGLNQSQKCELISGMNQSFLTEFGDNRRLRKQLGNKFRVERDRLTEFINLESSSDQKTHAVIKAIKTRNESIGRLLETSRSFSFNEMSQNRLFSLLRAYIHMTMNRLFISENRKYELVCYDLLTRHYKSEIARMK
ncbi:thiopeptide-type bacteriocin biosynthesis protein [Robiginitalea sp. M366]|uniref:thiopeptide-type bacteriocin biosynthesis protein n=1 Tax=Robiginitalea aestuariiviva TaxID=3036903 RepID=UPI00240D917A|nr:thiopeptide-type bacteriocin biosynthesis protein [Robiginitalea aestuariiviva]MDG1573287.1 thiopeptide-type bacteriocin biosynthesis protein [Robiginitalea aestuariiviva]